MPIANGIHHLALSTREMKKQIQFFGEVCGMELTGLFWMHGTDGAFHCFLKLNDHCYMSFVQTSDMGEKEAVKGISYASHLVGGAAPGAFQHVAFNVGTQAELLALRDRIRKSGYQALGTMDHGISKSIYLNAPENIIMEFTCTEDSADLTADMWVYPECAKLCGFSDEELKRCLTPTPLEMTDGTVPNPKNPVLPFELVPEGPREQMLALSDAEFSAKMDYTIPPNAEKEKASAEHA